MSSFNQDTIPRFATPIDTSRLTLTLIDVSSAADIALILACFNSPIAHRDMGDFGLSEPEHIIEMFKGYYVLPHHSRGVDFGRQPAFYIIHEGPNNPNGTKVGFVALTSEPTTPDLEPHIGWQLLPEFMGRGYATEAAVKMKEYWTKELGVCPIRATIKPTNVKSLAIARRLGMEPADELNEEGKVVMWWHGVIDEKKKP